MGGAGFDPKTGWLYVNSNEMPWISKANKIEKIGTDNVKKFANQFTYNNVQDVMSLARWFGVIPGLENLDKKYNNAQLLSVIKKGQVYDASTSS